MEQESNDAQGWSLKLFNFMIKCKSFFCTELAYLSGLVRRAFTSCSKVLYAPTIKAILRLLEKEVNKIVEKSKSVKSKIAVCQISKLEMSADGKTERKNILARIFYYFFEWQPCHSSAMLSLLV